MGNKIIISTHQKDKDRIAVLSPKGKIIEYYQEPKTRKFNVGDLYLAEIKRINSNLNAAFVDIGHERDAFLHYLDLGPQYQSIHQFTQKALRRQAADISKMSILPSMGRDGTIQKVLKKGQKILVQITKEAIATKGVRLSASPSIAGRYLILVPFNNGVNVSKRIKSDTEAKRLYNLIQSIRPHNFGVIVRTVAQGKESAVLHQDLKELLQTWQDGITKLGHAKIGTRVIEELNLASTLLRDVLNHEFNQIVVDKKKIYYDFKEYVHHIAPDKEKIVSLYEGKTPLFEQFDIERQLKADFSKTVNLPSGGYLIVEQTEALSVIDVNSGRYSDKESTQEESAFQINVEAAKEIARIVRVRSMGGIFIIDFISMKKAEHRQKLYELMKEEMKEDRAKTTVFKLTKLGLMQITRERIRPVEKIETEEYCPGCLGSGKVSHSINLIEEINLHAKTLCGKKIKGITLFLPPLLYYYYTTGWFSQKWRWRIQYRCWIQIKKDALLPLTNYRFADQKGRVLIEGPHKKTI